MVGRIIRQIWVIIESIYHLLNSAYMSIHLGVIILVLQLKKKKKTQDSERINNICKVTMPVHKAKVHTLTSSD